MSRKKQQFHFHPQFAILGIISIRDEILWIEMDGSKIFWDAGAFRPDPREYLNSGQKYKASIIFDIENLSSGALINFPREIIIDSKKTFVNIR